MYVCMILCVYSNIIHISARKRYCKIYTNIWHRTIKKLRIRNVKNLNIKNRNANVTTYQFIFNRKKIIHQRYTSILKGGGGRV